MTCRWTCTLGMGSRELDKWIADLLGTDNYEYPVHRCVLEDGHEGEHTDGDLTWTATTITVGVRIS